MAREGQEYPCYQRDMMMMMMINLFSFFSRYIYHDLISLFFCRLGREETEVCRKRRTRNKETRKLLFLEEKSCIHGIRCPFLSASTASRT